MNYKVLNYFYRELFEILVLSSFSVHSLPITVALWSEAWYAFYRSIIGSSFDFRSDSDVCVSTFFLVPNYPLQVLTLQRSSLSRKESHQTGQTRSEIRKPSDSGPYHPLATCR